MFDYCKNGEAVDLKSLFSHFKVDTGYICSNDALTKYAPDDKNIYINRPNAQGLTALHLACAYGHEDVVDLLLEHGAMANAPDKEGYSPLHSLISEVPLPAVNKEHAESPNKAVATPTNSKKADRRPAFLKLLKKIVMLPAFDLAILTDDGDSILDIVRDDDDGIFDNEVLALLEQALKARNIDLDLAR